MHDGRAGSACPVPSDVSSSSAWRASSSRTRATRRPRWRRSPSARRSASRSSTSTSASKEGIYAVIIDREVRSLVDRIKAALSPGHPSRTIVRAVDTFLEYIEEEQAGFRILVRDAPDGSGRGSLPSVLDEIAQAVEELLAVELKDRGFSPKMAPVLSRCLVGMIAMPGQWWLEEGKPRRRDVADQIVNLAWNGLGGLRHRRTTRDELISTARRNVSMSWGPSER